MRWVSETSSLRAARRVFAFVSARTILTVPLLVVALASQSPASDRNIAEGYGTLSAVSATEAAPVTQQVVLEAAAGDFDGVGHPQAQAVRESVERALKARGVEVVDVGAPILRFRVWSNIFGRRATDVGSERALTPSARIDRKISDQRSIALDDSRIIPLPQATIPLRPGTDAITSHFAISFFLYAPGEEPTWSASIEANGEVADPDALLRRMARAAIDAFGASTERTFALSCGDGADRRSGLCLQ